MCNLLAHLLDVGSLRGLACEGVEESFRTVETVVALFCMPRYRDVAVDGVFRARR